jgi:hypothetical protein
MFSWFKKKPKQFERKELELIAQILFPSLETRIDKDGNVYQIDKSVDTNLESILYELQDGNNDRVSHDSLNSVIGRLIEVRKILDVYPELDKKTKYIIVDDDVKRNIADSIE